MKKCRKFKLWFLFVFALLAFGACKKNDMNVTKITLDHEMALSVLNDTISVKDMLGMMDSTTNNWLRVRNDSIFVFYNVSVNNVLNGSDFMSSLGDVDFNTAAEFELPDIPQLPVPSTPISETIDLPEFASLPFSFEGVAVSEIRLSSGTFSLDFSLEPAVPAIKEITLSTDNIVLGDGSPLTVSISPSNGALNCSFDLAGAMIAPDNEGNISLSGSISFEYDPSVGLDGGLCVFSLSGSFCNMGVDLLSAEISRPVDSTFNEVIDIDFGINGIDGHLFLPSPKIDISYCNTFGVGATCRVDELYFIQSATGQNTNLLSDDNIEVSVLPTDGAVVNNTINGLAEEIDALGAYSKLVFSGEVAMNTVDGTVSMEKSDKIDIAADVELPFRLEADGVSYSHTLDMNIEGDINDEYPIDEVDLFFDFNNQIPLNISFQAYLQKEDAIIDSLFDAGASIEYGLTNTMKVVVNTDKLNNLLDCDKMLIRFNVSTESISSDPVQFRESDYICVRLRMLAKVTEIDLNDFE